MSASRHSRTFGTIVGSALRPFRHLMVASLRVFDTAKVAGATMRKWVFAVVAAAVVSSSPAWTMQFNLRPEQVKQMALTATQARAIAEFKTVAVLVAVPNKLVWNPLLSLSGIRQRRYDKCGNVLAINDWNFSEDIERQVSVALSSRFTVVSVPFDADAVGKPTLMGQIPRSALPVDRLS